MKPQEQIYLVASDYLKVIKVAGYSGNLALNTSVTVNTTDNSTTVSYSVRSWNTNLRRLDKQFNSYQEAYNYYVKLYNKFKKN